MVTVLVEFNPPVRAGVAAAKEVPIGTPNTLLLNQSLIDSPKVFCCPVPISTPPKGSPPVKGLICLPISLKSLDMPNIRSKAWATSRSGPSHSLTVSTNPGPSSFQNRNVSAVKSLSHSRAFPTMPITPSSSGHFFMASPRSES